jgi:demethylmenaquinone methyltransferase/2-methoxy-6-polyprenyl-1,4-benzoquinol methylase
MNHSAIRNNYNRLSSWYDWFSIPEQNAKNIGLRLLDVLPGENVLEIGFGTGRALVNMSCSAGEDGKVYGIDISDGMLRVAQDNIYRAKLSNRISLQLGDAVNLPFKNDLFDAIFISFTLELLNANEILIVLQECKRVLHADGRIGLVSMDYKDCLSVKIYNWFHTHLPSIVDCTPIDLRNIIGSSGYKLADVIEKYIGGLPVVILTARKFGI